MEGLGSPPRLRTTPYLPQNPHTFIVMKKYKCPICKYVYDPEKGDPKNNIPAGTAFEDLPEDWVCPLCKTPKKSFVPVED